MNDLFAEDERETLPFNLPGAEVSLIRDFLSRGEADAFFSKLHRLTPWEQRKVFVGGKWWDQPRLIAWYGDAGASYSYSGLTVKPHPWAGDVLVLKQKVEAAIGVEFNSVLLNLYRTGRDSVSWHSDNERELGRQPVIASVSLGAERLFRLKPAPGKAGGKLDILLPHGSLLVMAGDTQKNYYHAVEKLSTAALAGPRINLTFRHVQVKD